MDYDEDSAIPFFATYLLWIVVVIIMYPLCKYYKKFKYDIEVKKRLSEHSFDTKLLLI